AASGRVLVYSGAAAMGQGTKTMLAEIVAAQLGRDLGNITVTTGDTAAISMGIGGFNSRQTVLAGSSAELAARKVRAKVLDAAAHFLEVAPQDLDIAGDQICVAGVGAMKIGLRDVARALSGTAGFSLPGGVAPGLEATEQVVIDDMTYANGSAVVEVAVD